MAHRVVGNLLVRGNDLPTGIPLLERALTLADAVDDPVEAAECCACLTLAYFWSGQLHRAQHITLRRLELAERCHEPYQARHIYPWLAIFASLLGNPADADQLLLQAESAVAN